VALQPWAARPRRIRIGAAGVLFAGCGAFLLGAVPPPAIRFAHDAFLLAVGTLLMRWSLPAHDAPAEP
jgi:hypothetical protein